jgi:hypothetical protein
MSGRIIDKVLKNQTVYKDMKKMLIKMQVQIIILKSHHRNLQNQIKLATKKMLKKLAAKKNKI